jgi:hypothetical protein
MKKMVVATIVVIFSITSFLSAAEKKDTVTVNAAYTQQSYNKGLAKQNKIVPRKQSNWAKIKDLFM